jgi:uncharacterized repeat protein (TIGR01451 family)
LFVYAPPQFTKTFGAPSVALNGSTTLTFNLNNPNGGTALTGVSFTDTLPAGVIVSTPTSGLNNTCGGTPTATAGSGSVTLSGATLPAAPSGSCVLSVSVTGTTAGVKNNATNNVTSVEGGSGPTATANLTVVGPPTFTKSFGAPNVAQNAQVSLTFNITNPNATAALSGIGFTDTLPAPLTVSTPPGLTGNTCSVTPNATAGTTSVSLSGATLAAGAACQFTLNVTAGTSPIGPITNTTSTISSVEGGSGAAAQANVNVQVIAPPNFTKSFGAPSIQVNGSTTLTFNISNPNSVASGLALSGIGFTDTLPNGLIVSTPNGLTGSCPSGVISATAGSGTVGLTGAALAANANCSFTVNVKGTTATTKFNTTSNISSTEAGQGGAANASLVVAAPPVFTKAFGAASIPVGGATTLTFTIINPNGVQLTGVSFTDTFPGHLLLTGSPVQSNSCGLPVTAVAGTGVVSVSNATLAFGPPCTLVVNVTSTTGEVENNTTTTITSNEGGTGAAANASLNVDLPPTFTKSFGANSIPLNGATTLTFNISNPNAGASLSGVGFVDSFPAGLTLASSNQVQSNTCTSISGTLTANASGPGVTLSGATLAASGACSIVVNVTANLAAPKNNVTTNITSTEGGNGTTANATLNVLSPPQFTKNFGTASIAVNGGTSLTFNISNPNGSPLTGVSFNDTFPNGLVVGTPSGLTDSCNLGATAVAGSGTVSLLSTTLAANASCTVVVNVTAITGGVKNNTTNNVTSNEGGNGSTANASVTAVAAPQFTKAFGAQNLALNGTTTLTFNITNPNATTSLTGIAFTDSFPAGLALTSTPLASNACSVAPTAVASGTSVSLSGAVLAASASCTIVANVTTTTTNQLTNTTGNITSTNGGTGSAASASLNIPTAPPNFTKSFGAPTIPVNGTTTLTFNISNPNGGTTLTGIGFTDNFPVGLTLTAVPIASNTCNATPTAAPNGISVSLSGATLPASGSCSIVANVKGITAGTQNNTTSNISSNEGGSGTAANASVKVGAPPVLTKSFGAPGMVVGDTNTVSFTISNPGVNTVTLTGIGFTDSFPLGLAVATPLAVNNNCNGTFNAIAGATSVSLSGATLAPGAQCSIALNITVTQAGTLTNTTSVVTSNEVGNGFTASATTNVAASACTSSCQITGTVNGPWFQDVTITVVGGGGGSTTTDASGNYTITGLTGGGQVTVTPSLLGYNYNPGSEQFTLRANSILNFTANQVVAPGGRISGTVSYAGAQTGIVAIRAYNGGCVTCSPQAGTTVNLVSGSANYTLPNVPGNSNYVVTAEMYSTTVNAGPLNESNPSGASSSVFVSGSGNTAGVNVTLTDQVPNAPVTPTLQGVFPSGGEAFVSYKSPTDGNNKQIATSYKLYFGTDAAATNGVGSPKTIPAGNSNNVFILTGLTDGTAYYFKMTAVNGTGPESTPTAVSGPVTVNSTSGSNTVSGTVNFSGITPTGNLYVGVYSSTNGVFFQTITSPVSPQAFSFAGVPAGSYFLFAVMDQNGNGVIDTGDVTNFTVNGNPPPLVVSGASPNNTITLTSVPATGVITTNHQQFVPNPDTYSLNANVTPGVKSVVSADLFSGKNVAVPFEMISDKSSGSFSPIYLNSATPTVGDIYMFLVRFSDGTSQIVQTTVSAVLNSFATGLAMQTTSPGTKTVPLLTWIAPNSPPPPPYTYAVGLFDPSGTENWGYSGGNNSNGIPSTQTSALFDVDGQASPSASLTPGKTYDWNVTVIDSNGNTAREQTTYTVSTTVPPTMTKAFGTQNMSVGDVTTLTFTINNPNPSTILTGVGFNDPLPAGLQVAANPGINNTCGGVVTANSGSGTVSLAFASLLSGGSCSLVVNVTAVATGVQNNVTSAVTSTNGGTGNTASASVTVSVQPPQITKSFGSNIQLNGSTTLLFTITNPNSQTQLTGVGFTDTFPAGLVLTSTPFDFNFCGGTLTDNVGASSVTLSGVVLTGGSNCLLEVNVTATTGGIKNNVTSNVTSVEGGAGNTANASLTVVAPPLFTKNFGAAAIALNGSTTLTFTITNPNASTSLTGVSFFDSFPAGLLLTNSPLSSDSCNLGPTATAGGSSVSLSNATLAASASCTIVVNVTANASGVLNNTTNNITSNQGGNGSTANASLNVTGAPLLTKNFGAASIPVNGSTTLTFNITNPNASTSLSGIGFTDPLPSGLVVAAPNGLTGNTCNAAPSALSGTGTIVLSGASLTGGSSCGFTVNVTGSSVGLQNNTTSTISSNEAGSGAAANASITVTGGAFSISGTVTYSGSYGGPNTRVFIRVYDATCLDCGAVAETSIPAPGAFTVNGVFGSGTNQNYSGNYVVNAEMDTLNAGYLNAQNPSCYVGSKCPTVSNISGNVSGLAIPIADRTTAVVAPSAPQIAPSDQGGLLEYQPPLDTNNEEIATSYKVYTGTDVNASTGPVFTFPASGDNQDVYILSGLTNGTNYFALSAVVNGVEAKSTVTGPVTIGATTGANTVSGTVTFTGTPTGPLYVGVFSGQLGVYSVRIPTPTTSPVSYSVSGVPVGSYQAFAIIDNNNDGSIDFPDFTNFGPNGPPPVTVVSGTTTNNLTTNAPANLTLIVDTHHNQFNGSQDSYFISFGDQWGLKRPVGMQLTSGSHVTVPWDLPFDANNGVQSLLFAPGAQPHAGDAYTVHTTFSDGTVQDIQGTVTAVLNSFPQNLVASTTAPGSVTVPNLTWNAPASPPAFYTYEVDLFGPNTGWSYSGPKDSGGIPSTQTSVLYNVDGKAQPNGPLAAGQQYTWFVTVRDANQNTAQEATTYTAGVAVSFVTTNPTAVIGSGSVGTPTVLTNAGSVNLSGVAPTGGASVTLSSSNTTLVTVPPSVTVAAGQTFASFNVNLVGTVGAETPVTITASYGGASPTTVLKIEKSGTVLITSLNLIPSTPLALVGGDVTTTNTVTVNIAPAADTLVSLSSNNPSIASVPANVTVKAGQTTSQTFSVTTSSVNSNTPVGITATLIGSSGKGLTITPPLNITSQAQLPLGAKLQVYPATNITKSGGAGTMTYSISSGALPSPLTISTLGNGNGQITGTPSAAGISTFTVQARDQIASSGALGSTVTGTASNHTQTQALSIQVDDPSTTNPCLATALPHGSESMLSGPYAIFLQGFKGAGNTIGSPVVITGSFTANPAVPGAVSTGAVDLNNTSGHQALTVSGGGYTVGANGQACVMLNLTGGATTSLILHFAVGGVGVNGAPAGAASTGRIIEFDDYAGSGTRASGVLRRQDSAVFAPANTSNLQPRYAFGIDGGDTIGNGHLALAGTMTLAPATGLISNGTFDSDDNGALQTNIVGATGAITGVSSATGRAAMTFTASGTTLNYAVYIVNQYEAFLEETDPSSSVNFIAGGRAIATASAYTASSLSGPMLYHSTGIDAKGADVGTCISSAPCAVQNFGILTATPGGPTLSGSITFSESGFSSASAVSSSYSIDASTGRMTISGTGSPIVYVATPQLSGNDVSEPIAAFIVGSGASVSNGDPTAILGFFEPQTPGPYSTSSINGNFILHEEEEGQNQNITRVVGQGSFSSGVATLNRDRSSPGGLFLSAATGFTFTVNSDGTGSGTSGTTGNIITNGNTIYFLNPNAAPASFRAFERQ